MRHCSIDWLHLITRCHPPRRTRQRRLSTLLRQRLVGSHRRAPAFDEVGPVVPSEEEDQEGTGDPEKQCGPPVHDSVRLMGRLVLLVTLEQPLNKVTQMAMLCPQHDECHYE